MRKMNVNVSKMNLSRRAFVQAGLAATFLAGCSGGKVDEVAQSGETQPQDAEQVDETAQDVEGAPQADEASGGEGASAAAGKTLVVFYSRADENYADGGTEVLEVGHTKVMAGYIAEALGADTFEIVPQQPYPFSYEECCDQASVELADDARPAIAGDVPDVSGYETVFIGCPIWWGSEPMVVRTFLDATDLSGKTVVPFTTHGGSGLGSVPANLEARITGATLLEAKAVAGTAVDTARDEVVQWVRGLGL